MIYVKELKSKQFTSETGQKNVLKGEKTIIFVKKFKSNHFTFEIGPKES